MKSFFFKTFLAFVAVLTMSAATRAQKTPEHARLATMVGTWDVDFTVWPKPGAQALSTKATSTIQALFGGTFIEERIEGTFMGAPFGTMSVTGFNTGTHQYEATRISSNTNARLAEAGTFDEKTNQFELKADYQLGGETWHQRTVISQPTPDTMIATSYLSFGTVPEWKGTEIKYTRRSK